MNGRSKLQAAVSDVFFFFFFFFFQGAAATRSVPAPEQSA
jgi:hypothetical protein